MFNAPEKVGVVSLEATAGQYTLDLLSLHLEQNLLWLGDGQDIIDYLDREDVQALYDDLLTDSTGQSRFAILDERDGDIKMLEKQIEKLIHQHGCKIIVIDVLTDILRGSNSDLQEDHMKWQKQIVKSGITIINVLHTRKPPTTADGAFRKATEFDAFGSSSFVQAAAINIVISRNKMSPDSIQKNLTFVDMPKCRGGITGEITQLYYAQETRQVVDYEDYMNVKYGSQQSTNDNPPEHHNSVEEPDF
jgi:RecA-family ATPase